MGHRDINGNTEGKSFLHCLGIYVLVAALLFSMTLGTAYAFSKSDDPAANVYAGAPVAQYDYSGTPAQRWYIYTA